jgi:putative redox protein
VDRIFSSDDVELAGHLARPRGGPGTALPGLVIAHGFPPLRGGGRLSAKSFPELADRIATELGWFVLVFTFRGCGDSAGDFSLRGWLDDLQAASRFLRDIEGVRGVWLAGFGTGGALSLCAAADDPEIRGVAAMGAPADFDDWASHPRRLLQHSRDVEIIHARSFPPSFDVWARGLRDIRAVSCAERVAPRPLLLIHGSDDDAVPVFDARVLADAHGAADLRILDGGSHQLRHDPRAIAILLGWLDLQRSQSSASAAL